MKIKINLKLIVLCLIIKLLIDYIYYVDINPSYSYLGLVNMFNNEKFIISIIVTIIFSLLLNHIIYIKKSGAIVLSILLIVNAIPLTTIIAFFDVSYKFIILNLIYWILFVFIYLTNSKTEYISQKRYIKKYESNENLVLLYFICLVFTVVTLYLSYKSGFSLNFNLFQVYERRSDFNNLNLNVILIYLYSASIIVFPIIFVYALRTKKKILAIVCLISDLLVFNLDGRKSTLLVLLITIFSYYFIKNFNSRILPPIFISLNLIGILEKGIFKSDFIINFIIRRLFVIPNYLHYGFFTFFSTNDKDFFKQSILRRIGFISSYSKPIPIIIGENFYGGSYANNGLFSDAYSNLGILGVILMPIFIALLLKILDNVSRGLDMNICVGIIVVLSYTLLSSSIFAVLLTHGLLIGLVLVGLIPRGVLNEKEKVY